MKFPSEVPSLKCTQKVGQINFITMKKLSPQQEKSLLYMIKKDYDLSFICSSFNLSISYVRYLRRCYKETGHICFSHNSQMLSVEDKVRIVVQVAEKSLSLTSASIKYNLASSTLNAWVSTYLQGGLKGLTYLLELQMKKKQPISKVPSEKKYTEEYVKKLEYKLLKAEAEIAFLKKLRALIQADKRK